MSFTKITQTELNQKGATTQPDRPTISAQDLKRVFDAPAKEVVAPAYNRLIDELEATTGAGNIGAVAPTGRTGATTQAVINSVSNDLATLEGSVAQVIADDHTHANKALLDTYTQTEADLADAVSKKHSHSNKNLLDTYTQTEANLSDAVSKKHAHSNKSLLDTYTQTETDLADAVAKKHDHSNKALLDTYTQTDADIADAVDKKHAHSNKSLLDTYDQTNANIKSAVDNTHSHSNKAVLDELSDTDNELYYKGAPVGGGGGGTSNYNNLSNKPQINSTTLSGNKSLADLGIQGALTAGDGINITGTTIALDLGMLTGSNLTKAVAGKDIKDALDAKQPTLTFDNVPTKNSTNPVKSGGIYDAISPKVSESLLEDTVGWVGKNKLPSEVALSNGSAGVSFTVDENKVVTLSGSNTTANNVVLYLSQTYKYTDDRRMIFSLGDELNGSDSTYYGYLVYRNGSSFVADKKIYSGEVEFGLSDKTNCNRVDTFALIITPNASVNGLKLYPMLRDASITDSTYEPPHKPVTDVITDVYGVMGENGAKNIIAVTLEQLKARNAFGTWSGNVYTYNGVTYTPTIRNGYVAEVDVHTETSASADSGFYFYNRNTAPCVLKQGNYTLNGCPSGGSSSTFFVGANGTKTGGSWAFDVVDVGSGINIDYASNIIGIGVFISVKNGATLNHATFKPMLRDARDTDSTYQPPCMTNRELTDAVTPIDGTSSITSDFTIDSNATKLTKIGKLVSLSIRLTAVTKDAFTNAVFTIPEGFRPNITFIGVPMTVGNNGIGRCTIIGTSGNAQSSVALSNSEIYVNGTWITD